MLQFPSQLDREPTGREWHETSACAVPGFRPMRGQSPPAPRAGGQLSRRRCRTNPGSGRVPPHLIKTRILIARGTAADLRSAQEILHALFAVAERNHNRRLQIEVMALRALALDTEGRATAARDMLQAAVDLAKPGGFARPLPIPACA